MENMTDSMSEEESAKVQADSIRKLLKLRGAKLMKAGPDGPVEIDLDDSKAVIDAFEQAEQDKKPLEPMAIKDPRLKEQVAKEMQIHKADMAKTFNQAAKDLEARMAKQLADLGYSKDNLPTFRPMTSREVEAKPKELTLAEVLDKLAQHNLSHFEGNTADVGRIKITFRAGAVAEGEPPDYRADEDDAKPDLYNTETWAD